MTIIKLITMFIHILSAPAPVHTHAPVEDSVSKQLDNLAHCESTDNPKAVDPSGTYFGSFQFDLSTWHSNGQTGNPVDYSYSYQKSVARKVYFKRGWQPWPACSVALGYS